MEEVKTLVRSLSQPEFDMLLAWAVGPERDRREREASLEVVQARVIQELVQSGKLSGARYTSLEEAFAGEKVPSWRDPKGDITRMYPYDAVVARAGEKFISTLEGRMNGEEPGASSFWRTVTDEIRVATLPPEVEASEPPVPEIVGDNELGLQDGSLPPGSGLEDADPEPDPGS